MAEPTPGIADSALTPAQRRSFWLCVGNGAIVMMGNAFFAFETIMAGLAYTLTGSKLLVGLMICAATIGWQWPQLIVGSRIEHLERKLPIYRISATIRACVIFAMIVTLLLLADQPAKLYWGLLFWTIILSTAGGICVIPFLDVVGKTIPHSSRAMLFAYRRFFGGVLGFVAGGVAVYVLSAGSRWQYPYNYVLLISAGFVGNVTAFFLFGIIKEPPGNTISKRTSFSDFLQRGLRLFKQDRMFRNYYLYRACIALGLMTQSLLVPFFFDLFDADLKSTGWFAASVALTMGLSSLFWGPVSRHFGESLIFKSSALLLLPASGLALMLYAAATAQVLPDWVLAHYIGVALFLFISLNIARNGMDIAGNVYLIGLPPSEERPLYVAVMNTFSAPFMLLPILAGWLADVLSYGVVFALSTTACVLAFWVALGLRRLH